jgi:nicotinamidase/pyrazinamidase
MPKRFVLWEVDAQEDFMLSGGKLYVPSAEKIIPNLLRLVQAAASSGTLLVSSACAHSENDPEFQTFPPHCIKGTVGARIVPEGMLKRHSTIPADPAFHLPANILGSPQIVIEKQMLDVFSNPHTTALVDRIGSEAEYIVFGVVTEYCVRCASKGLLDRGRKVFVVQDAIETLNVEEGRRTLDGLQSAGAKLVTTSDAVGMVLHNPR